MNIESLEIRKLEIPFKMSFSHASATRHVTDSVIVTSKSNNVIGYGEACPRSYVTNENYESVLGFFNRHQESIASSITGLSSLKSWAKSNINEIDTNPAAWCAIELALLDLLAKNNGVSVENLLGYSCLSGDFQYTAVLGDSSIETFTKLLKTYLNIGFTDFKLKLSGNLSHDKDKCDVLLSNIDNPRIRLDANNLWNDPEEVVSYIQQLGHNFFALEEPIKVNDYEGMSFIANKLKLKIVLDESFIQLQQFEHLLNEPDNWIINIRISKMGGLLRSLVIADYARTKKIPCIVGAQVGETSLLTRAALTLVNEFKDIILAQEGAGGTYLLKHDLFNPVLMFANAGKIDQSQLKKLDDFGFGLRC